ncbi:hypothetical protein HY065_00955 [Candidatus Berkelbacteria bacterium]|nr:hypothetical protein [Candidatus Berkelbacteria bacterium]
MEGSIRTFYPPAQLAQSSVTPRLQDMLYVYALAFWHNEQLAKLLHFSFGVFAAMAVYALGRRLSNTTVGLLAAAIFVSFPIFGWLSQTAYIDLSATFYGALVALAFFTDIELFAATRFVVLGLFLSTKIWALIILPIIFGYEFIATRSFDKAVAPIAGALFVASPWFFEALITTGNPVFPIFSFNQPELLGGYATAGQWLIRGWPQQFWPNMQKMFVHNFTLLTLIPGLVISKLRDRSILVLLILSVVMYLAFSVISNPDPRFFLPFIAIPSVLLAKLFFDHGVAVKTMSAMAMGGILIATFIPQYLRTERVFPVVFGGITREQYLRDTLGDDIHTFYDVNHEVSSRLLPNSKVVAMVHNQFYITFSHHDGFDLKPQLQRTRSPQELLTRLKQLGFTHILVKTREYKLKDLFTLGDFSQLTQLEYEKLVPIVWSSDVTNTALYKIP